MNTVFIITPTGSGVNCKEFERIFGNPAGLMIRHDWLEPVSSCNCRYSCSNCKGKCDYWESE